MIATDDRQIVRDPAAFHCVLDEQPSYLIPSRLLQDFEHGGQSNVLWANPRALLSSIGRDPTRLVEQVPRTEGLATGEPIVWVDDAIRGISPFWLGHRFRSLLSGFTPGQRVRADLLTPRDQSILRFANVLLSPTSEQDLEIRRSQERAATQAFAAGYAAVDGLLHPFLLGALRRYYRSRIRQGAFQLGDGQSPRRYAAHDEPVARYFHHQLTGFVSRVAGVRVKPSYTYFISYQDGAELLKHTDRAQCEYSITLLLDHSPEPIRESPWPISLHPHTGLATIYQAVGDALIYRGHQIPHSRTRLMSGATSTSLLFHYVDESFQGALR